MTTCFCALTRSSTAPAWPEPDLGPGNGVIVLLRLAAFGRLSAAIELPRRDDHLLLRVDEVVDRAGVAGTRSRSGQRSDSPAPTGRLWPPERGDRASTSR